MDEHRTDRRTPKEHLPELRSAAVSLSDMEIFIFPDLMYALVLANIMSPEIWKWRDDPWFADIERKSVSYRVNRVKQYIMDHFVFNLDLDTWGLTTKERELERFKNIVAPEALAQSNALFGYEGDKYYYNVDIRRHFGLDKYTSNIIPYWKTETVEAMTAFRYKEGYTTGAGECVSLSALYMAALFIVGHIPLDNLYMIATPLHSQNFLAEKDGLLTNNRRLVTKKMWFNGTELSAKARRSVEHEKITIVSHITGVVHTFYRKATMNPERYAFFEKSFRAFLQADLNFEYFVNFLYSRECYWDCFQLKVTRNGKEFFVGLPCIFNTQRTGKNRLDNESRTALIDELHADCFSLSPYPGKILLNPIEEFLATPTDIKAFRAAFEPVFTDRSPSRKEAFFTELGCFLKVEPRLPAASEKEFTDGYALDGLRPDMERDDILSYIYECADRGNEAASLALYAYRDLAHTDWEPFLKAAFERNPVCLEGCRNMSEERLRDMLSEWPDESIYEGDTRLAQPDEVWNFRRGDGLEKALLFWNVIKNRYPSAVSRWTVGNGHVEIQYTRETGGEILSWSRPTQKNLRFPHTPDLQAGIIGEATPIGATSRL